MPHCAARKEAASAQLFPAFVGVIIRAISAITRIVEVINHL